MRMYDSDPATTAPLTPTPPPPPKKTGGQGAMRLLAIGVLAFAFAVFTGRLDLAGVVSSARGLVAPTPAARTTTTTTTNTTGTATVSAIKDVIERANHAQARAFAKSDDTLMRDTATDSYYQELVQTNRDLASGGVTSITGSDATWVGIGGLSGRDLLQAGTQAMVSADGMVEYSAWTEMLPQTSHTVPLAVRAGDAVTATLTQKSGNSWIITINNDTTKANYSVTVQYSSSNSSAEWIQEAPSAGRGLVPLDQFGTLRVTAGSAVQNGKSQTLAELGARAITMINGAGQAIAQPSLLGHDGSTFTVTRTDAPSTSGRRGRP